MYSIINKLKLDKSNKNIVSQPEDNFKFYKDEGGKNNIMEIIFNKIVQIESVILVIKKNNKHYEYDQDKLNFKITKENNERTIIKFRIELVSSKCESKNYNILIKIKNNPKLILSNNIIVYSKRKKRQLIEERQLIEDGDHTNKKVKLIHFNNIIRNNNINNTEKRILDFIKKSERRIQQSIKNSEDRIYQQIQNLDDKIEKLIERNLKGELFKDFYEESNLNDMNLFNQN